METGRASPIADGDAASAAPAAAPPPAAAQTAARDATTRSAAPRSTLILMPSFPTPAWVVSSTGVQALRSTAGTSPTAALPAQVRLDQHGVAQQLLAAAR